MAIIFAGRADVFGNGIALFVHLGVQVHGLGIEIEVALQVEQQPKGLAVVVLLVQFLGQAEFLGQVLGGAVEDFEQFVGVVAALGGIENDTPLHDLAVIDRQPFQLGWIQPFRDAFAHV